MPRAMSTISLVRIICSACVGVAALAASLPGAALAQYSGTAPPPQPPPIVGMVENPSTALARNVRLLVLAPRSFDALIGAGRAAVAVGDPQAAVGFFGRAEEVNPKSPLPKAGTAAALVAMEQPSDALGFFEEAVRLGASQASIGADRGLAYDLTGDAERARADYRAALAGPDADEARRRLALSLAIGRDRVGALAALEPLLGRRDPATERVRAFVLALTGDVAAARLVVEGAMPGAASNMAPFLEKLSRLSPDQQAAAVHFGRFPEESEMKFSAVAQLPVTAPAQATPSAKISITPPAPSKGSARANRSKPREIAIPVGRRVIGPSVPFALPSSTQASPAPAVTPAPAPTLTPTPMPAPTPTASPIPTLPPTPPPTPTQAPTILPSQRLADAAPIAADPPRASPGFSTAPSSGSPLDRLSEIERLLGSPQERLEPVVIVTLPKVARAPIVPPPAQPKVEPVTEQTPAKKAKAKPADGTETVARTTPKPVKPVKPVERHWVQLAGGAKSERMPFEYQRIKAKKPALFAKRTAHIAELKGWTRLLVGPFKTEEEAQDYVNQLAKADIDGFSWTSPTGQTIEKLPAK